MLQLLEKHLHVRCDAQCREDDGGGGEGFVDREAAAGECRCTAHARSKSRVAPQVHIGDMQWEGVLDFQR